MDTRGERPHPPTCPKIRERRSGACSTGSRAGTLFVWTPPKACLGGDIDRYGWTQRTSAATWFQPLTYVAEGKEDDGYPSLRYLTLLRDGARAHGLPEHYIRFLEQVEHAPEPASGFG
jgi:hypothetical protein